MRGKFSLLPNTHSLFLFHLIHTQTHTRYRTYMYTRYLVLRSNCRTWCTAWNRQLPILKKEAFGTPRRNYKAQTEISKRNFTTFPWLNSRCSHSDFLFWQLIYWWDIRICATQYNAVQTLCMTCRRPKITFLNSMTFSGLESVFSNFVTLNIIFSDRMKTELIRPTEYPVSLTFTRMLSESNFNNTIWHCAFLKLLLYGLSATITWTLLQQCNLHCLSHSFVLLNL